MKPPARQIPIQQGYPLPARTNYSPPPIINVRPPPQPAYLQPPPVSGRAYLPPPIYTVPPVYSPPPQPYPVYYNRPPGPIYGGPVPPPPGNLIGYPFQPIPGVVRRPPPTDFNMNFDYEQANFLTDTKIVQNSIFCVICGQNFKGSQREQHLKLHMRRPSQHSHIKEGVSSASLHQKTAAIKKNYIVKPIIEPEEHVVLYEPLVYDLVEEIVYEDPSRVQMQDQAIGYDPSFSQLDPNVSIDYGRNTNIPRQIETQTNPFIQNRGSTYRQSNAGESQLRRSNQNQSNLSQSNLNKSNLNQPQGNTLNEPVPFLNNNPLTDPNNLNKSNSLQIHQSQIDEILREQHHSILSNNTRK